MSRVIHFFNYLDYEDLENLQFKFIEPTKDDLSKIYSSNLENPMHFYLPKSEILEVYQDDFGINKITYKVDTETHPELLQFCDNLDSLCINLACINSNKWFGKDINADVLIKYLNSIYSISDIDDTITIDIDILDVASLDKLSEYNDNDNMNLLVTISSIEFFKKTFRLKLELNSILLGIPDESNTGDSDLDMDFNELLENSKSHIEEEVVSINKENNLASVDEIVNIDGNTVNDVELEATNVELLENNVELLETQNIELISHSKVINKETINDLADINSSISKNITSDDFDDTISKETINEIESIIGLKQVEKQKYLMNAERARRASVNLVTKATKLDTEITDYQTKLRSISESVISNFN